MNVKRPSKNRAKFDQELTKNEIFWMHFNVLDSSSVSYHKLGGCIGKILTQFSFFDLIYDCVTQPPEKNEFDHNVKDASS